MGIIYHITTREQWEQALELNAYWSDTLESEGFIHCSSSDQIVRTANHYFRGRTDLVLLTIDEEKVQSEIRYEALVGTERFPHIYGPLNLDAVLHDRDLTPLPDGTFTLDE